jgi:hypothetical protein
MKAHPDRPPRMMADSRALNLQRKQQTEKTSFFQSPFLSFIAGEMID